MTRVFVIKITAPESDLPTVNQILLDLELGHTSWTGEIEVEAVYVSDEDKVKQRIA